MKLLLLILLLFVIVFSCKSSFADKDFKVYVVSFAHNCCKHSQENLEKTAYEHGADKVFSLNLETLEAPEYVKDYIRNNHRFAGYCCWKPYIMKQVIKQTNPGDVIIYTDSGTYYSKNLSEIISFIKKNNVFCFTHELGCCEQYKWTKMNAVQYFGYNLENWCETEGRKTQVMAALLGVVNNEQGNFVVDEWLKAMDPKNASLYDDSPSTVGNCEGFKESRHDQQMLSLILYKYLPDILHFIYSENSYGWRWHETINGKSRHE